MRERIRKGGKAGKRTDEDEDGQEKAKRGRGHREVKNERGRREGGRKDGKE